MKTIKERAEELYRGNTIEMDAYKEGRNEQKAIDIDKAWRWIELYRHMDFHWGMEGLKAHFIKTMEE